MRFLQIVAICAAGLVFGIAGPDQAHAENGCPNGFTPWRIPVESQNDCVAITDYGNEQPAPPPRAQWQTRWGAIATANGAFGAVKNQSSKRKAESAAMVHCKANGGADCEVAVSYSNQCAALVWGENWSQTARSPYVAQAENLAMQLCNERAKNCRVFYSDCSIPVRIR
jgi:hypothetical protein